MDEVFNQALRSVETEVRPLKNEFYGDHSGTLKDPFAQTCTIATHLDHVPENKLHKRAQDAMASAG